MDKSRHISPLILLLVMVAASGYMLVHIGAFKGAFQTKILATLTSDDVLFPDGVDATGQVSSLAKTDPNLTSSIR
ncbi:hypothetical protein [Rhizobium sp. BK251]|uniref:hypothetical protein n=1 Tax=Rhizobium sp. BK251 TaxID=2512125 RepID=UPI00104F3C06|nr:hypothetical protein [Rhizobium sp. BK251]TCL75068.1 hypothetical protein EV286_102634 [Rhizobium sp. BK251]